MAARFVLISLLLLLAQVAHAQRGMEPEDYYHLTFVSDPQISPDGRQVLFVRSTISDDRRSRESNIWIVPADGSAEPRPFTSGKNDRSPRWSPDGSQVAFISRRDDRQQIYLIFTSGGEARALTDFKEGSISDFSWSPDGRRMLLTLNINPEIDDPREKRDEEKGPKADVVVIRDAVYKSDGTGFLSENRRSLWLLEVGSKEVRRITSGTAWHDRNASFSPDGRSIVFNADRSGEEFDGSFNQDLYVIPVDGGEPRLVATPAERSESPLWSPDGQAILYQHRSERYAPAELHLIPAEGGTPRVVHDGLDISPTDIQWPGAGRNIYFTADDHGARPLFRLNIDTGERSRLLGEDGSVRSLSFSRDGGRVAFTLDDERTLAEVWSSSADGSNARQLSDFNRELLDTLSLSAVEEFRFLNETGTETHGYLIRPVGWREGERYPLVLNIKGGPGGMWGRQWFHEFQMMAARGYAVLFVNYRGSTGYGHTHQDAVRQDYGGVDYLDNIAAVDTALARFEWIDPDQLFITGGSHGGFLTNWITTRTDRFRAAVTQRSVSNWISEAGTQEFPPRAMREEFGGTIWENFDYYWDRSPLKYADRVTTPTLVIHSTDDHITPIGQGKEWFYALKANGVPAEMVVFKGEGHSLSRSGTPVNLVERLTRIMDWFDRWREEPRHVQAAN